MKTTVAIVGLGSRGRITYAPFASLHPDKMEITAAADIDPGAFGRPPRRTTFRRSTALPVRRSCWPSPRWPMPSLSAPRTVITYHRHLPLWKEDTTF